MSKFVLFDTETTGLGDEDRIIQIGAIILDTSGNMEVFDELCQADKKIEIDAMETHHITNEMIEGKGKFIDTKCYKRIQELNNSDNFLIAHNIKFDLEMIRREGFECKYTLIDTLKCAKHLFDELPCHRLQYMRYYFELYKEEEQESKKVGAQIKAHDAIGDVIVMKLLLGRLITKAKEMHNSKFANLKADNAMDLLAKLSQTPVLIKKFTFGKYRGCNLEEVSKKDVGYFRWMLDNNADLDEDMRYSLEYYLK